MRCRDLGYAARMPAHASLPSCRRAAVGLASTAVLALTMAGCGSESAPAEEASATASSSASASTSPSASASASAESSGAKQEYLDAVRAAAEEENASVRTKVLSTIDSPQGKIETVVTGVTQVQDGVISADLETELPQGQGTLRTLIVDGVFYVQGPGIPKGKFAKYDLATSGGPLGEQLQQQLDQIDPRAQAEATVASVTSVEKLGEGSVNGVDVTEYRVNQDFAAFAKESKSPLFDQLLQSGAAPKQLTSVVSLDDEGRVRRTELDLDVQGSAVKTVADFLEYDVDVDITAPPKSKVAKMPQG